MVLQFTITWSYPTSRGGTSVMHSDDGATLATLALRVNNALGQWANVAATGSQAVLDREVRQLDDATGQLIGVQSFATQTPHEGTVDEEPVANATMGLVKFATNGIVAGHRVRGRWFIPYLGTSGSADGEPTNALVTALNDMGDSINQDTHMSIYARPLKDENGTILRPGSVHNIASATAWTEFAVQRRRR